LTEKYAGTLGATAGGIDTTIYLLSVDVGEVGWAQAQAQAQAVASARAAGGFLPSRREWLLLLANLGGEFPDGEYWTSDEVTAGEEDAWFQYLYNSSHESWVFDCRQFQDHKGASLRVVAIRRVDNTTSLAGV
jgi:hypothetical protein